MSNQRLVECFNGTPVTQLSGRDLVRYNVALTRLNNLSGNIDCGKAQQLGITWEYKENKQKEGEGKS